MTIQFVPNNFSTLEHSKSQSFNTDCFYRCIKTGKFEEIQQGTPVQSKVGDKILLLQLLPQAAVEKRPSEILRGIYLNLKLGINFSADLIFHLTQKSSDIFGGKISEQESAFMRRWYKELANLSNWQAAFEVIL